MYQYEDHENERKDYRDNWKFSILKEHFFHSPLEILLLNQKVLHLDDLYRIFFF
jgi:hypothetical protein